MFLYAGIALQRSSNVGTLILGTMVEHLLWSWIFGFFPCSVSRDKLNL